MPIASLHQTLDFLGRNPNEIARKLRQRNIRGQKKSCTTCPIAQYLILSGFSKVSVDTEMISTHQETVRTPHDVRLFIKRFDAHEYPELRSP